MKLSKFSIIALHLLIGFLLTIFNQFATIYSVLIIIVGTYYILNNKDINNFYPIYFSIYIVGVEVLLRMAGAKVFWEFGKYSIVYFLIIGILKKRISINFPSGILWYLLLLLPGVLLVPTDQLNIWRQDISFNLSGSITLTVSAIYFFNTIINKSDLKEIFYYMSLPIIAMSIYNIFNMPDLSTYRFLPYSDAYTSGGYGPNQVSSIFGFGVGGLIVAQILKLEINNSKILDLLFIIIFSIMGLITFSRGGMLAVVISFSISISYYLFRDQKIINVISKSIILFLGLLIAWYGIIQITDGVILKRYGLVDSSSGKRFILDLTGRAEIYKADIDIFSDYIFTGVGLGQANNLRVKYGYGQSAAAHTEYSRMLAEHGILGLISLIILFLTAIYFLFIPSPFYSKFLKIFFCTLAILTMGHSAMRLAMPCFIFGFLFCKYK